MVLTLTPQNLSDLESNVRYKSLLRMSVLGQAGYWGDNPGTQLDETGARNWFKRRSLAEGLLAEPSLSVNQQYWASKSLATLKNEQPVITYPAYDAGITYQPGQRVTSAGAEYVAIATTLNNTPAASPSYWTVLTAKDVTTDEIINWLEANSRFETIATVTYEGEAEDKIPF